MKIDSIGEVIGSRTLRLEVPEEGAPRSITISIGTPQPFPDSTGFFCPYQITGAGSERLKYAGGVDAIQALQLVMPMIGADLFAIRAQYEGRLQWGGSDDVGFPEAT